MYSDYCWLGNVPKLNRSNSKLQQGDAQVIALRGWKAKKKKVPAFKDVPKSLEASVKPLQRDILLSQKQRAFSKAVVLVAPEKRLLVVVLTAAVSSRSSSQCKRPVFVTLLP